VRFHLYTSFVFFYCDYAAMKLDVYILLQLMILTLSILQIINIYLFHHVSNLHIQG